MPEWVSIELAGIFVGGRSRRMGGRPKGLLLAPTGETLVQRWQALFAALGIPVVLVGQNAAYANLGLDQLADDPPKIGPLGGLIALLSHAADRDVIAVACDMPFVSLALLEKLATFESGAPASAPRNRGTWEPLFARYSARVVLAPARELAAKGELSLQCLLGDISAEPLPLTEDELTQLRDWDCPADLAPL